MSAVTDLRRFPFTSRILFLLSGHLLSFFSGLLLGRLDPCLSFYQRICFFFFLFSQKCAPFLPGP